MTQAQALSILKAGVNVFLSGEPGSGKTHTIRDYVKYLRNHGIEPAITASTGIAATHISGSTIHSWSGIGIKTFLDSYTLDRIASTERIVKRVSKAKILIIDEVSMLPAGTLSMVDQVAREIKQSSESFGGLQVVLVGDFFQLPPIVKAREKEDEETIQLIEDAPEPRFAYDSSAWAHSNFVVCYLTEQHRQDDAEYLSILSAIRRNSFTSAHFEKIKTRQIEIASSPYGAPKLFSHNADVDRINNDMLSRLPGDQFAFSMTSTGSLPIVEALKKGCLSPEKLLLKAGAIVMFTKNNPKANFVNGTLGRVLGFDVASKRPIVRTNSGTRITVEPMEWTVEENGKIRAAVSQLPLRLAWAITVHKSQGMSMDEAVMDLSEVFEYGQGYVALSRVRRLAGLHLLGSNERAFRIDPAILVKDESFREASNEAEATFAQIPAPKLEGMHRNFILASGGSFGAKARGKTKKIPKSVSRAGFEEIRRTYPNAYVSWDKADDKKLEELFHDDINVSELAVSFGRKPGAIRSRLVKLGLMQENI